jgi:ATP-dependent DNA helicase RecQ
MSNDSPTSESRVDQVFNTWFASVGKNAAVRPVQRRVIDSVVAGHNTLALMPTGSGKSLCYWIAGKILGGVTLVISPLTALMDEQAQKLAGFGCKVATLHSGIDSRLQYEELLALYRRQDPPEFIFLSPERLATDGFLEYVLQSIRSLIHQVVVDEAHCISQWGLDFRPFYKDIPQFLDNVFGASPRPAILCLTATLNPKDREEICRDLDVDAGHVVRHPGLLRESIKIEICKVPDEDTKDDLFWALLEAHRDEKILIYIDKKRGARSVEALCAQALEAGFKCAYFHADLTSAEKLDVIQRFKDDELMMVFATSAFGMGIDIPDIRGVVHYRLPESAEQYYQQIGRVGRDGNPSWAVLYYSDKNVEVRRTAYIESSFPSAEDVCKAFDLLSDRKIGRRTVNYFDQGDSARSAYHYLVRSGAITAVCKGIQSLQAFEPARDAVVPGFEAYRRASRNQALITTAKKTGDSEPVILRHLYHWLAEGQIQIVSAASKCMVIESVVDALPDELIGEIMADAAAKKAYRLDLYYQFVGLLEGYTDSGAFHLSIGEYLGIGRFSAAKEHKALSGDWVRSKSEVIIANLLYERRIPFEYETRLASPDGATYLPDFTIHWDGKTYYWEHLGLLDHEDYRAAWERKERWYQQWFPGRLITTRESPTLSHEAEALIGSILRKGTDTP